MSSNFESSLVFAQKMDFNDSLNPFRKRFHIQDKNTIYLDGNSLGRLPEDTKTMLEELVTNQWGNDLIKSWNKNWYTKSEKLGDKIAQIIGADNGEVVVSDSTSVNLYKLAKAALSYQKGRTEIVSDVFNFPTDLYILQGIISGSNAKHKLKLAEANDEISININDLKRKITKKTALLVLSLVAFKSSFLYNAEEITSLAHQQGALVLWDLSHAAGAVPININTTKADLAVGCTYKYLNGGPGSPAFLYVRKDLQNKLFSPVQGWFGDKNPFEFDLKYKPANGIKKFLTGTPPVISQLAIEPGLNLTLEAGIENIYKKSIKLSEYFIYLYTEVLKPLGFKLGSPLDSALRGSHVSLKHPEAYRICTALIEPKNSEVKVIPDFREPDNIRFGLTPLYTTFTEVYKTIIRIEEIISNKEFEMYSNKRKGVT